ncbi:unnamed protein product [Rotaria sp. Silwood2]|nr:unnamed protein product [Rotaria sp. Silwood2]CAF2654226.1 unnamed protein product [Rotaria sp. Silwood2]CAF3065087.1 unnamed protein product [Rotaria sp. Silwood2]CAF4265064.1 unnamed protein product [Rotaria sp. Silwood2]
MVMECVCCDSRIESKNRRPFCGIALRSFVSARRNLFLPESGFICNACRMCYYKWRNNSEFIDALDHIEKESGESIVKKDDKTDDENMELINETLSNDSIHKNTVTLPLNVTISSHQQCSVCREALKSTYCTISEKDRDLLFIKNNIFIPKGSRCCRDHIVNERLCTGALNEIRPFKVTRTAFAATDVITGFTKFRDHYSSARYCDFEPPFTMSDIDCYNLTGISKSNFDDLSGLLANSDMKNSSNRSIRNATGLFLTKIRLGLSNKVLTTIFQFSNAKAVSRTLASVRQAMLSNFVPCYLGFNHISREDVIYNHSSPLATRLLSEKPNTVVLAIDGTYLYVQVCNGLNML